MKLSIDFLNQMEHLFSMPITISNVSGEIKSEIGSLVRFYKIRRITPVQSMYGKGVFGKTLFNLINQTHSIAPENKCHCSDSFNCCDCGGSHCGCGYCFSCNACDECLNAENNLSEKLGIQKKDGSWPDIPVKYEDWILLQNKVDKPKFSGILAI